MSHASLGLSFEVHCPAMSPTEDYLLLHADWLEDFPCLSDALEDMVLHGAIKDVQSALWTLVGKGGFAYVSRIRESKNEQGLAIKTPKYLTRPKWQKEITWERECMQRVTCAPAVTTLVPQNHGYILMEHLDGQTLHDLHAVLPTYPLAVRTRIAADIAACMQQVEAADLLHCDITPGNVMLRKEGGIALMDFNLAVQKSSAATKCSPRGTTGYIAPERKLGILSSAGEVFGLAATLYRSFFGDTSETIAKAVNAGDDAQNRLDEAVDGKVEDARWNALLKQMLKVRMDIRISLEEAAAELAAMARDGAMQRILL
jgi:serine/threonine protein kinase